jgi:hypothetical protein
MGATRVPLQDPMLDPRPPERRDGAPLERHDARVFRLNGVTW